MLYYCFPTAFLLLSCCFTTALLLSVNGLDDSAAGMLGDLVSLGFVGKLDLCSNELSSGALSALRLSECRGLKTLRLANNELGDAGAAALSRALAGSKACQQQGKHVSSSESVSVVK